MAPWPEPESEPKAPDKTNVSGDMQIEDRAVIVKSESVDDGDPPGASKQAEDRNPGVSELDDLQLKKLLDEAITYKRPKDREGKSTLFRELLQEAEADESEDAGGQRGGGGSGGGSRYRRTGTRKGDVSERNSRGGSLQNLVFALNSDLDTLGGSGFNRKRAGRRNPQPQVSVSARQREGGSLPCNVNADYYTTAAVLRSPDDLSSNSSAGKRLDHTTPIDDVVTGNAFSYKLGNTKYNSVAVDDLASYRVCSTGKRAAGSVDDIVTAAPRGTGSKRRELKKLGHSSDDIFTGACGSDDNRYVDDLKRESDRDRYDDIKNDNVDICDLDTPDNYDRVYNNVDNGRTDNPLIDIDFKARRNGPPLLGLGFNGTVRPGPDRRWTKSESRKDDDFDGTEMIPLERSSDILKYSSVRSSDHSSGMEEVDQSVDFLLRKSRIPNGDMVQLSPSYPAVESLIRPSSAGESVRGTIDSLGDAVLGGDKACPTRARQQPYFTSVQISQLDKDMRFLRVDQGLKNIQQILTRESEKKNYDENGNSVHQFQTSGLERKFKKKCKTDKNPYVLSDSLPGHRGDIKDINELLLFIESDSADVKSTVSGKNNRNSNGPVNLKESKQRNSSSNGKRNDDNPQKVKSEKRKTDKNKLKKSNSLEEISHTKLSDLTSESVPSTAGKGGVDRRPKKQATLDDELSNCSAETNRKSNRSNISSVSVSDRRSWGPEDSSHSPDDEISSRGRKRKGVDHDGKRGRGSGSCSSGSRKHSESSSQQRVSVSTTESEVPVATISQMDIQLGDPAEFHVVTKKQRKKKTGRSSSIGRNQNFAQSNSYHLKDNHSRRNVAIESTDSSVLYHYRSVPYRAESPDHSQHHRRKSTSSMPPSDKSADSSDLDSVHSLPISSTTPRPVIDKTSTSSGSTPQASYADIARMASSFSPPQGQVCNPGLGTGTQSDTSVQNLACSKWPSVGQTQARPAAPLWTANVTLHAATPLPASHEEGDQSCSSPQSSTVTTVSSPNVCSSAKRDAMTNTVSLPEAEQTDSSSVGNLLSDHSYPPLCESGKTVQTVTQSVKTFISQASRTSPAVSHGVTMANCVDVEDSAKRAASPLDSARDHARTSATERPAVIILDDGETETPSGGDPELTFGFEINEMLLSGTCTVSSDDDDEQVRLEPLPLATKVQPSPPSIDNINLDKIVAFVGRAWEDVMKELPSEAGVRGRVQYYNGQ